MTSKAEMFGAALGKAFKKTAEKIIFELKGKMGAAGALAGLAMISDTEGNSVVLHKRKPA